MTSHAVVITMSKNEEYRYFSLSLKRCPKLRTLKNCLRIVIVANATYYHLSLTKMDASRVINWTVIIEVSWQYTATFGS